MSEPTRRFKSRLAWTLITLFAAIPGVMAAAWIGAETMIEQTSGAEFCSTCHTMEPLAESHQRSKHGGVNAGGVIVKCADCHLPHNNPARRLYVKATTGLHDIWAQAIYPVQKPDWIGNLEHRADYVYDSGCLRCHAALRRATRDNPAAQASHEAYFARVDANQPGSDSCVSCHQHVGHQDLRSALRAHFDEQSEVADQNESDEQPATAGEQAESRDDNAAS